MAQLSPVHPAPPDPYADVAERVVAAWRRGEGVAIVSPDLEWLVQLLRLHGARTPDGLPCVWFGPGRASGGDRLLTRALEIAVAAALFVVGLPLWLLIALAARLETGAVVYASERAGQGGVPFRLLKFRTMTHPESDRFEAERRRFRRAVISGASAGTHDARGRRVTKDPRDPRITRLGRLLRSTSLDEVLQFHNVLTGSMRLVGPRPYVLDEVESFKPWHHLRHEGRPGITGLWQVCDRTRVSFDQSVVLDIYYLANRSFWLDLGIAAQTPLAMLLGRGAH